MPRIANKIVLVEDAEQQNLVHRYLERCGHNVRDCRFERAASGGGSGEQYVRNQYPKQVQACRSALGRRASALLVVMIDADMETTQYRALQLSNMLSGARMAGRRKDEPIVVLIPKRHIETWIRALLGTPVFEEDSYKNTRPTSSEIREAAGVLHEWTRPNAKPGATSPTSLTSSLPEWRKIP